MNVTKIPLAELKADLAESMMDIKLCATALRMGFEHTRGQVDVKDRLHKDAQVVRIILNEVERRVTEEEVVNDENGLLMDAPRRRK